MEPEAKAGGRTNLGEGGSMPSAAGIRYSPAVTDRWDLVLLFAMAWNCELRGSRQQGMTRAWEVDRLEMID
jgi:hypothetical protein